MITAHSIFDHASWTALGREMSHLNPYWFYSCTRLMLIAKTNFHINIPEWAVALSGQTVFQAGIVQDHSWTRRGGLCVQSVMLGAHAAKFCYLPDVDILIWCQSPFCFCCLHSPRHKFTKCFRFFQELFFSFCYAAMCCITNRSNVIWLGKCEVFG